MKPDPIMREVYRMKAQVARETGNDIDKLFALIKEEEKKHPERLVDLSKKAPTHPQRRRAAPKG